MATDKKITQLGVMTQAGPTDVLPIVNVAGTPDVTEQITTTNLFASPQPIGSSNPKTGAFTTLELPAGSTIDEFSTDGTLAGDSDTAVPTEKAVKAYVDAAIPSFVSDRIEAGDSSVIVSDSTASPGSIDFTVDTSLVTTITSSGLQLSTGARINEFSTDTTLADSSDTAVPTENAVKTYVDNQIATVAPNKIYQGDVSATAYDNTSTQSVVVVTPVSIPGPDTTAVQILYFNSFSSSNWNGQASIVDGNIATFGRAGLPDDSYAQTNNGVASFDSTAIITTAQIVSVEIRVRSRQTISMSRADLIPVFSGTTDGNTIDLLGTATAPAIAYTPWVDITNDPSGPGTGNWTWTDVQNLDSRLEADATSSDFYEISIVQLRVTTTSPGPSVQTLGDVATFDTNGIKLLNGVAANEISSDGTLSGNSNQAIPTEYAVKTYVDNQVIQAGGLNVITTNMDTTAVNHDAILVDTSDTTNTINIGLIAVANAQIIIKKITSDSNTVDVSVIGGLVDGYSSVTIDSVNKAFTFISDGINYYVV